MPSSRLILALKLAAAASLMSIPTTAYAGPEDAAITAVKTSKAAKIGDFKGRVVALHFLTRTKTPECDAFVKEVLKNAPSLPGVTHIFIKTDPASDVKAWAETFKEASDQFFADEGGALAKEFELNMDIEINGVKSNPPATIVLSAEGKVVVRAVGTSAHDHPSWTALAKRIDDKRKAPLDHYNLPKGKTVAVDGYDVVAYFTDSKATKGSDKITSLYKGVTYQFAKEENRALFAASPQKYAPTYGGWCASAMGAKGEKVEIDPEYFKVKDGRLFLFYHDFFSNALTDWNKHEKEWEPAADTNWKKVAGEDRTPTPATTLTITTSPATPTKK
ncbi:MAG: YHS domain-containing (seleno)protein [Planctomycetota bacterium]